MPSTLPVSNTKVTTPIIIVVIVVVIVIVIIIIMKNGMRIK